jgi:hypothetical protein
VSLVPTLKNLVVGAVLAQGFPGPLLQQCWDSAQFWVGPDLTPHIHGVELSHMMSCTVMYRCSGSNRLAPAAGRVVVHACVHQV